MSAISQSRGCARRAPGRPVLAAIGALLGTLATVHAASAAEPAAEPPAGQLKVGLGAAPPAAQWYVEIVGSACQSQRTAFEREITLACEAVGGTCRLSASPKEAELRAILDCTGPSEAWTLETRTIEGTVIEKIELAGESSDRLREGAVEVARDAAPERALAVETLRNTIGNEAPAGVEKSAEKLTLLLGGRATTTNEPTLPLTGGAHLLAGLALGKIARGTLGLAVEAGGSDDKARRALRGGAGVGIGAPFDSSSPVGVAAEVGIANTSRYATTSSTTARETLNTMAGYGQATFTVQWPRVGLRPYASLSAAVMSEGDARLFASGEAGLALAVF
ncbi:MAG TPA: hypothetical protein VLT33_18905 [Labilithrix sp.]|nr:hypothetical protein [Labilithrix sp.]